MTTFSTLALAPEILKSIDLAGYTSLRPIQEEALPAILSGKDVLAQAQTGSGKTLAFALGCLAKLNVDLLKPQGLILCPTRELADQVAEQCRVLARAMPNVKILTLCGGQPLAPQAASLKFGAHLIVGTPGRVMDHVTKRTIDLSKVKIKVLDEADRMLDMGFADDLATIFSRVPKQAQTLMFSATFEANVEALAQQFLRDPETIKVDSAARSKVSQLVYKTDDSQRYGALRGILTTEQPTNAIVFCRTRANVQYVAERLSDDGFSASAIQGEMEQWQRNQVLVQFASNALNVLVATDVAARGLDISAVDCVVNYDVSEDPQAHIHRIGRTGRADAQGQAFTLMSAAEEGALTAIELASGETFNKKGAQSLRFHANRIVVPEFSCLALQAGKKQKLRAGDILGALTKDAEVPFEDVGKITIQSQDSFVAVKARSVKRALRQFREGKIKGKRVRARKI
jgi:ATP-independent RNA helicase DbpA